MDGTKCLGGSTSPGGATKKLAEGLCGCQIHRKHGVKPCSFQKFFRLKRGTNSVTDFPCSSTAPWSPWLKWTVLQIVLVKPVSTEIGSILTPHQKNLALPDQVTPQTPPSTPTTPPPPQTNLSRLDIYQLSTMSYLVLRVLKGPFFWGGGVVL